MKILFLVLFMISFIGQAGAEVCINNATHKTANHFAFSFIQSPVIDRKMKDKPILTTPQQLTYTELGDQEDQCLEYIESKNGNYGYFAIFINTDATDQGWFWISKEPISVAINDTLELIVSQTKNRSVYLVGKRVADSGATSQIRIPLERVISQK